MGVATLLVVVTGIGAWVRFDGITEQGITPGDCFGYLREAKVWADGEPPKLYRNNFYRPVAYFLQGNAIRLWGYNDYSIKLMHAGFDVVSLLLIFAVGRLLSNSSGMALSAAMLYALIRSPIYYARSEMVHSESTLLVLLGLLFFILYARHAREPDRPPGKQFFYLVAAGLFGGLAANTHADLAFLAPCYGVTLLVSEGIRVRGWKLRVLLPAALFSAGFFIPYLVGMAVFGPDRVIMVMQNEFSLGQSHIVIDSGKVDKVSLITDIISISIARNIDRSGTFHLFFFSVPILMGLLLWRRRFGPYYAALPFALVVFYVLSYAMLAESFGPNFARLFIPFVPLVIISIVYWYHKVAREFAGRWALLLYAPLVAFLLYAEDKLLPPDTIAVQPYREVYDILRDKVDASNKLLITPAVAYWSDRGFRHDLYFGENAQYQVTIPLEGAHTMSAITSIVDQYRIGYILDYSKLDQRYENPEVFLDPENETWLRSENFEYALDYDREAWQRLLVARNAHVVAKGGFGVIYSFSEDDNPLPMTEVELISNGSFKTWSFFGKVPTQWVLESGSIEKGRDATEGEISLQLNPVGDGQKATRVRYNGSLTEPLDGTELTIQMDMKATSPGDIGFMIQASFENVAQTITRGMDGRPTWIRYSGNGEWVRIVHTIALDRRYDLSQFALYLSLGEKVSTPAKIDAISIRWAAQTGEDESDL